MLHIEKCRSTESIQGATGGCPVGSIFRLMNYDIASKYEENREAYETNLQKLLDGLDAAAFKTLYGTDSVRITY